MAKVKIQGHASGTGVLTVTAPNTNTDRTITLPDGDVTMGVGIDDNANATAMTIDSSENVLVGKTSSDTGNSLGFEARQNGLVNIGRDGGEPLLLNRNTSDGDIMLFRKDGTTVGSIGVDSGDNLYITGQTGNTGGIYINDAAVSPAYQGAERDDYYSLGKAPTRWKDLYLSGGLKVGGTGASNTLDDYEEGTWTPSLQSVVGSISMGSSTATYTKVGRLVTCQAFVVVSSVSSPSGRLTIQGLPFTKNTSLGESVTTVYANSVNSYTGNLILRIPYLDIQTTNGADPGTGGGSVIKANSELSLTFSYFT